VQERGPLGRRSPHKRPYARIAACTVGRLNRVGDRSTDHRYAGGHRTAGTDRNRAWHSANPGQGQSSRGQFVWNWQPREFGGRRVPLQVADMGEHFDRPHTIGDGVAHVQEVCRPATVQAFHQRDVPERASYIQR
jgi:outer membrane receptor protein involved in Fe transport